MKHSLILISTLLLFLSLSVDSALAQQNNDSLGSSLHQAVVSGDIEKVKSLISDGADVNARNRMNWTPLHTAVRNRRKTIVELLIEKGADVNAKQRTGQTPLHVAVDTGQKDVVEVLIAKGADVNASTGSGENALSLARSKGLTEIAELLVKHGAVEPTPEDVRGDRLYGRVRVPDQASPPPDRQRDTQPQAGTTAAAQSPAVADILADPNEIRARVKSFEGLEKALEEVAVKGQSEVRQWRRTGGDNRTLLIRVVHKQFEDESSLILKAAVDEKAEKTTEAIKRMLDAKRERVKKVSRELLLQRRDREEQEMETARMRGRARTTGRGTRGRSAQRGPRGEDTTEPLYGHGEGMNGGAREPSEPMDRETQDEINLWAEANVEDFDGRADLANAVHEQIQAEMSSIRTVAVEEDANRTTATIDGLLLARQQRLGEVLKQIQERQQKFEQAQERDALERTARGMQGEATQQQNSQRTRRRR